MRFGVSKKGVLLVNIGTPNSYEVRDVRTYLKEFLSDPRVLDIPSFFRWLLVHFIIAPLRGPKSAKLYKTIWGEHGSPVYTHGLDVEKSLQIKLGEGYNVKLAMRYGKPSIKKALEVFQKSGVNKIKLIPLYPQYSSAAYGSSVAKVYEEAAEMWNTPFIEVVEPYYEDTGFIDALAQTYKKSVASSDSKADKVLMSFHGVPLRHVKKSTPEGTCQDDGLKCCDKVTLENKNCYRAQCFATGRALAKKLELDEDQYEVVFQSRFGRDPWIVPDVVDRLGQLQKEGLKNVLIMAPSFVADCLETIEELGIRLREDFKEQGGENFTLIPCVNSSEMWIAALADIAKA